MMLSLRSDVEVVDPSEVPDWVLDTKLGQFVQVATVTVLVYDTITTMDKEVKYFWNNPRKSVNVVYFANRYIGIFGSVAFLIWNSYGVNLATCNFANWTQSIANYMTIILIDYILMIRVLALYSKDRLLSIFLKVMLVLEAIIKFGLLLYVNLSSKLAVAGLAENVTACGTDGVPSWQLSILDWVIPLTYAVILLLLALYKAAGYWKMSAGFKGFALVKVLIQDQILYFLLVLVCSTVEIIQFRIFGSNDVLIFLLQTLGNPSFLCVLGSRLLVNLKEAAELGLNEGTNYRLSDPRPSWESSVSEMEFREGNVEVSDVGV